MSSMGEAMKRRKFLTGLLAALVISTTACGGGGDNGSSGEGAVACTVQDKNAEVYALMKDVYYWYTAVPDVNPANYSSPQALLDAIRYRPLDETFSYLTTRAEEEAYFENAAYYGYGFVMYATAGYQIFLAEVFPESPAWEAGLRRGDEIVEIDGEDVVSLIASGRINFALGPDERGYEIELLVRKVGESEPQNIVLAKDEVYSTVVGTVRTDLDANGERVGYIYFRSFVDPAFNELDAAFAEMRADGVTKLVLDMRYNGGGLLSVAEHLGSLIAGSQHEGKPVATIEFNDRYSSLNEDYLLRKLQNSADITDLVVITTGNTASASEMIINGLRPHMNVVTVGDNTYGKPVGQSGLEFCGDGILRAVTFRVVNSEGESDYFPPVGIPPTCYAEDDLRHEFGDPDEASLAEALHYLANGSCSTAMVKAAEQNALRKATWSERDPLIRDGKDVLRGGAR